MKLVGKIGFYFIILFTTNSYALEALKNNFFGENSRWSIDISSQTSKNLDSNNSFNKHVIGFDLYKTISTETHDVGTLLFQPYLVALNNHPKPPSFFDDGDDIKLSWRMTNFNYTGLNDGKFNIKVGHFEIPFGLEKELDTNGTFRQYIFASRSLKADWGASINGEFLSFNYEVAQTLGTGNDLNFSQALDVFSGRIGTTSHKNFISGISWFDGEVIGNNNDISDKQLWAIDLSYYFYNWELLFEHSFGEVNYNDVKNTLFEVSWRNAMETFHLYFQYRIEQLNHTNDWQSANNIISGIRWQPDRQWDISGQISQNLHTNTLLSKAEVVSVQLRFRL
jgi:hypothetical protein